MNWLFHFNYNLQDIDNILTSTLFAFQLEFMSFYTNYTKTAKINYNFDNRRIIRATNYIFVTVTQICQKQHINLAVFTIFVFDFTFHMKSVPDWFSRFWTKLNSMELYYITTEHFVVVVSFFSSSPVESTKNIFLYTWNVIKYMYEEIVQMINVVLEWKFHLEAN